MNERIKQLALQAGFIEEDGGDNLHVFDGYEAITCTEELKKFAELIVRKCLELAHDEHKMALEYEWDNDDTATSIRESISKHFGVEE